MNTIGAETDTESNKIEIHATVTTYGSFPQVKITRLLADKHGLSFLLSASTARGNEARAQDSLPMPRYTFKCNWAAEAESSPALVFCSSN